MADMTDKDEAWRHLGRLVDARLDQIGVDPSEVEQAGGPKATKLREIRNGRARALRKSLRPGLERALRWSPGDIEVVLRGGDPTPTAKPLGSLYFQRRMADSHSNIENEVPSVKEQSRLRRWAEIQQKPEGEWTSEDHAFAEDFRYTNMARTFSAEMAEERSATEKQFVDLVEDGQALAARKKDADVDAYVRRVESAVVGYMGFERLTSALDERAFDRMVARANQAGILEQFVREVEDLREVGGADSRDLVHRISTVLEQLLAQPRSEPTLQQRAQDTRPIEEDTDVWEPAAAMVADVDDKLEWTLDGDALAQFRLDREELFDDLGTEAGVRKFVRLALSTADAVDIVPAVMETMSKRAPAQLWDILRWPPKADTELDSHPRGPDVAWRGSVSDVDPEAGSGGMLMAAAREAKRHSDDHRLIPVEAEYEAEQALAAAREAQQQSEGRRRRDAQDAVENQEAP